MEAKDGSTRLSFCWATRQKSDANRHQELEPINQFCRPKAELELGAADPRGYNISKTAIAFAGSLILRRATEIIQHPDFLPDTVATLVGEFAEVFALCARMEKTEFGIELVELVLHGIEIGQWLGRERNYRRTHFCEP